MDFHSRMLFSLKKNRKSCTKNRKNLQQSVRKRKLDVTIHVHVDLERNIKNVVVDNFRVDKVFHNVIMEAVLKYAKMR